MERFDNSHHGVNGKESFLNRLVEEAWCIRNARDVRAAEDKIAFDYDRDPELVVRYRRALELGTMDPRARQNPQLASAFYRDLAIVDQGVAKNALSHEDSALAELALRGCGRDPYDASHAIESVEKADPRNKDLSQLKQVEMELERRTILLMENQSGINGVRLCE